MKITPLDIKQANFKKKGDRYDAAEVDAFMEAVRTALEERIRENERLKDEVGRLREETDRLRGDEKTLKEAIISIQQFSEDLKEKARREAELMVSEAELEADRIISQAQLDVSRIKEDVNELIRQRVSFETSLRRLIDVHRKLLEATVSQDVDLQFVEIAEGDKASADGKGRGRK